MAAAEQAREQFLDALVDPLECFLEPCARLAVDLGDCVFQRAQGFAQIVILLVEVVLALAFFFVFLDGRQVDRLQARDLHLQVLEFFLPLIDLDRVGQ